MKKNLVKTIRGLILLFAVTQLTACGTIFEKDNTPPPTPLKSYTAEIHPRLLWSTYAGGGAGDDFLRLGPALTSTHIATSDKYGVVTLVNKETGHKDWKVATNIAITTAPGAGEGLVVVGSRKGNVLALDEATGRELWRTSVPNEILARPVIAQGKVIIKTVDGHLYALSTTDGHTLWTFEQNEPALILRAASEPQIRGNYMAVGFANGYVTKVGVARGNLQWQQGIAVPEGSFAIQRMIDIDADPLVFDDRLYAATYQGKIAALDWQSGRTLWSNDISSYTGLTVDNHQVFITDAKSMVWSFDTSEGSSNWRQTELAARNITGPAAMGNYLVVGDGLGYLHWLSQRDGHVAGRTKLGGGAAIMANPVVENNTLYIVNKNGLLAAYRLG